MSFAAVDAETSRCSSIDVPIPAEQDQTRGLEYCGGVLVALKWLFSHFVNSGQWRR